MTWRDRTFDLFVRWRLRAALSLAVGLVVSFIGLANAMEKRGGFSTLLRSRDVATVILIYLGVAIWIALTMLVVLTVWTAARDRMKRISARLGTSRADQVKDAGIQILLGLGLPAIAFVMVMASLQLLRWLPGMLR